MEFAGSLGHDLFPSSSAKSPPLTKISKEPAQLEFPQPENGRKKLHITTPDIAYHADRIDAELNQLRSRKFWMLNNALDVKDLYKKLSSEVAGCKERCESLNKDLSDGKGQVELLEVSKFKLQETLNKLGEVLKEAKDKLQEKKQQLDELDSAEATLDDEINSKSLSEAQAELQKHQLQVQTVVESISSTKQQIASLSSQLSHLESELKKETEAKDELLRQISNCHEEKAALQQQSQKESEDIKNLVRSAADTKKSVVEKQALHQELELAVMGLRAKVQGLVDKKNKRGMKLDSLMEDLKVSEDEFSRMELTLKEIQNNTAALRSAIAEQQNDKNELANAKETLDSQKGSLNKLLSDMTKMAARKADERKKLMSRVEGMIQLERKFDNEFKLCQRQIAELNRCNTSRRFSKQQLQTDLMNTSCEVEKLRESISKLVREKEGIQRRHHQLLEEQAKLTEQQRAAKTELEILESVKLTEAEKKRSINDVKKVRFRISSEESGGQQECAATALLVPAERVAKKKGWFNRK